MQALLIRFIRQEVLCSKQNSMINDVLIALNRRREIAEILDNETKQLKSSILSKNKSKNQNSNETSVLRVQLTNSNKEVLLFRGQFIQTPMGTGQIESIQPNNKKVVIKLPFGLMYSCLNRVVCWGGIDQLDLTSDRALTNQWLSNKSINLPIDQKLSIFNTIGNNYENDEFTDHDDNMSIEDETVSSQIHHQFVEKHEHHPILKAFDQFLDKNYLDIDDNHSKVFPLSTNHETTTNSTSVPRSTLQKKLTHDILNNNISKNVLPLAFVPASYSNEIISKIINKNTNETNVELCLSSLNGSGVNKLCTTGSLAWTGDISKMEL